MNKEQITELLVLIESAYPRFLPTDDDKARAKVNLWRSFMVDWDYERAKIKIRRHIAESEYEPRISEVKAPIIKRQTVEEQLREGGVRVDVDND